MDIRFSVPEDTHSRIQAEAERHGFIGRTAVSAYVRHLVYAAIGDDSTVRPIIVQPTSHEQRKAWEAYATVKDHASIESWALHALGTMTRKDALTAAQEARYSKLVAEA